MTITDPTPETERIPRMAAHRPPVNPDDDMMPRSGAANFTGGRREARRAARAMNPEPVWTWQHWVALVVALVLGIVVGAAMMVARYNQAGVSINPQPASGPGSSVSPTIPPPVRGSAADSGILPLNKPTGPAESVPPREFAKMMKDSSEYAGKHVILFGKVSQADGATGTDRVMAQVDSEVHKASYGYVNYDINTVLQGTPEMLADVIEGDLFRAEAIISDPLDYENRMGATTSAPLFRLTKIEVTGSSK